MAIFVGRRGLYRHRKKYIGYQPYGGVNTWNKRYGRKFYLKGVKHCM